MASYTSTNLCIHLFLCWASCSSYWILSSSWICFICWLSTRFTSWQVFISRSRPQQPLWSLCKSRWWLNFVLAECWSWNNLNQKNNSIIISMTYLVLWFLILPGYLGQKSICVVYFLFFSRYWFVYNIHIKCILLS